MKKVYCRDCKYGEAACVLVSPAGWLRVLNKNNNCDNYKRKWWKFWV